MLSPVRHRIIFFNDVDTLRHSACLELTYIVHTLAVQKMWKRGRCWSLWNQLQGLKPPNILISFDKFMKTGWNKVFFPIFPRQTINSITPLYPYKRGFSSLLSPVLTQCWHGQGEALFLCFEYTILIFARIAIFITCICATLDEGQESY